MMHIPSMKEATKKKKIERPDEPDVLLVPLFELFGTQPEVIVKPGEQVMKYQMIAHSSEGLTSPVHAPVSGYIEKIARIAQMDGREALTIIIRNDHMDCALPDPLPLTNPDDPEELRDLINRAGIVGMGGAQFPTAKKYDRKEKKIKTFIINAAECEPYLTGDYALMREQTADILEGILFVDKILEAEEIVIGFERSNRELQAVFDEYFYKNRKYEKIHTYILPNEYPQGGELQLAKTITGIEIAKGSLPIDHGIIISNVGTVHAVYNAVVHHKPLIERVITVSGEDIPRPGNYWIKVGTPVTHLIKVCGIDTGRFDLVSGGPMMSPHIRNPEAPLHKGSLGIIAVRKEEIIRLNCIWCGYCVDVCPMKLMPMKFEELFRKGDYSELDDYSINDCIECGACEYICPSKVALIQRIQEGKTKLKKQKDALR